MRRQMDYNDIGNSEPEISLYTTIREKKFCFTSSGRLKRQDKERNKEVFIFTNKRNHFTLFLMRRKVCDRKKALTNTKVVVVPSKPNLFACLLLF